MKKDGILHNKAQDKAEILNNQFYSVFTKDQDEDIPQLGTNMGSPISDCRITVEGVRKLLCNIKTTKHLDQMKCRAGFSRSWLMI